MNTSIVRGSAPRIYYGYWLIAGAFVAQFVAYGIFGARSASRTAQPEEPVSA